VTISASTFEHRRESSLDIGIADSLRWLEKNQHQRNCMALGMRTSNSSAMVVASLFARQGPTD
jgi:hypothetical protein